MNMVSIVFVMVSTIAFMGGEGGTEAMVEAYSGESPMISRRVLLPTCARWLQGKSDDNVLRMERKED
jgi:hypothetical protein